MVFEPVSAVVFVVVVVVGVEMKQRLYFLVKSCQTTTRTSITTEMFHTKTVFKKISAIF